MTHIKMAEILSELLNNHEVEGSEHVLFTSEAEENAAFSELDVELNGETFTIAVRKR